MPPVPQAGLRIIRSMFIYTLPHVLRSLLELRAAPSRLPQPSGREGAEPEEAVVAALGHLARKNLCEYIIVIYSF